MIDFITDLSIIVIALKSLIVESDAIFTLTIATKLPFIISTRLSSGKEFIFMKSEYCSTIYCGQVTIKTVFSYSISATNTICDYFNTFVRNLLTFISFGLFIN